MASGGLTAVSLFAGIGGFDEALRRAGVRTVAAVEIDPECRGVLRRHFPETALFSDVKEVTGGQLRAAGLVPGRGIICAGWPCQGNSVAGRRKDMADPRSGLWRHVVRLLDEARPRWFLGENVPGLLSISGGRDFGAVLGDLDDLGYGVAWRVLDAQWFGVPQRRRRVFLVGCLGDPASAAEVLLEPYGGEGHPAQGRETRAGAPAGAGTGAVATLQGGGRRGHRVDAEGAAGGHLVAMPVAATLSSGTASGAGVRPPGRRLEGDVNLVAVQTLGGEGVVHALTSEGADASEDGTGRGTPIIAYALTAHHNRDSDSDSDSGQTYITAPMAFNPQTGGSKARIGWGEIPAALQASQVTAVAVGVSENQRGEVLETPVSRQLTTGGGKPGQGYGAVREGTAVRRLTPTECERLQGFPDGWTRLQADGSEQSDSARYRQLGNAVAVPVAEWIARRTVAVDSRTASAEGAA